MQRTAPVLVTPQSVDFVRAKELWATTARDQDKSYRGDVSRLKRMIEEAEASDEALLLRTGWSGATPDRATTRRHLMAQRWALMRIAHGDTGLFMSAPNFDHGVRLSTPRDFPVDTLHAWRTTDLDVCSAVAQHFHEYWVPTGTDGGSQAASAAGMFRVVTPGGEDEGVSWRRRCVGADLSFKDSICSHVFQGGIDRLIGWAASFSLDAQAVVDYEEGCALIDALGHSLQEGLIRYPPNPPLQTLWFHRLDSLAASCTRLESARALSYRMQVDHLVATMTYVDAFAADALAGPMAAESMGLFSAQGGTRAETELPGEDPWLCL